jgi:hypothetical protein
VSLRFSVKEYRIEFVAEIGDTLAVDDDTRLLEQLLEGGLRRTFSGGLRRTFGGGLRRSFGGRLRRSFGGGLRHSFGGGLRRSFGGGLRLASFSGPLHRTRGGITLG